MRLAVLCAFATALFAAQNQTKGTAVVTDIPSTTTGPNIRTVAGDAMLDLHALEEAPPCRACASCRNNETCRRTRCWGCSEQTRATQKWKSPAIASASVFCGAILAVVVYKKVIKPFVRSYKLASAEDQQKAASENRA